MPPLSLKGSFSSIAAFTLILVVVASGAQQTPPGTTRDTLADAPQVFTSGVQSFRVVPLKGLTHPWGLAFLPDGDMLITERAGRLRIVRNGVLDPQPITGIPPVLDSTLKGLMDIAIHPRFSENRLVYFTYTQPHPEEKRAGRAILARGRFDGGSALADVRDIFVSDAWAMGASAARIVFGPDGKIYMAIGIPTRHPIGKAESAQDPGSHAGKILRLNEDGSAPADNPFVGKADYRPEVYALGIRNALGLAFHPQTGELWEHENGPFGGDEINTIRPGRNYGWPVISFGRAYNGDLTGDFSGPISEQPCAPGMEQPFMFWVPSLALSGMAFYTGDRFPDWKGNLFVGALRGAQLQRITFNQKGMPFGRVPMLTELKQRIRDVKMGPDGLLYLLTGEDAGALLRIEPAPASQ